MKYQMNCKTDLSAMAMELRNSDEAKIKLKLDDYLSDLLILCGVTPKRWGYQYIKTAIIACALDRTYTNAMKARLYPDIGRLYGCSANSIEQNIRTALSSIVEANGNRILNTWLNAMRFEDGKPIKNADFIFTIADTINRLLRI